MHNNLIYICKAMPQLAVYFTDPVISNKEGSKGRSPRLINNRNRALCFRFFFHQKINSLHYGKCIENLSNEFFVSQTEIVKIIRQQSDTLAEIRKAPPTVKQMAAEFSFYNWG